MRPTAGRDAGDVLDGRPRGIPVFATIGHALQAAGRARLCGRRRGDLGRAAHRRPAFARRGGDRGRHVGRQRPSRVPGRRRGARGRGRPKGRVTIVDVRRTAARKDLHFWSGEIFDGRGAAHRGARHRLRPRQAHDGPVPARGLPPRRDPHRARLHRPDGLDAGRALRLHLRLGSERLRLRRARARHRLLLARGAARAHPARRAVIPAQSVRPVRLGVPDLRPGPRRDPPARARRGPSSRGSRSSTCAFLRSPKRSPSSAPSARALSQSRSTASTGPRRRCAPNATGSARSSGFPSSSPSRKAWNALVPVVREFLAERGQALKISRVESRLEEFALTPSYAIAGQDPLTHVGNLVVRIETDAGIVGLGAGSPGEHVTGETIEGCREALAPANLEWLRGRDVRTLPAICRESADRFPADPGRPRGRRHRAPRRPGEAPRPAPGRDARPGPLGDSDLHHHRDQAGRRDARRGRRVPRPRLPGPEGQDR